MKLQIISEKDKSIEGFNNIVVTDKEIADNLNLVVRNSCELVVVNEALGSLEHQQSVQISTESMDKVRMGGQIVFTGTSITSLADSINSESIDVKTISDKIKHMKSIEDHRDIIKALKERDFIIDSVSFSGINYQISALRKVS